MKFQKGNKLGKKFVKGMKPTRYWLGKKVVFSEQRKQNMRVRRPPRFGDKNPCWRGGRTVLNQRLRNLFQYRQWRSDVFTRDDFTCVWCGDRQGGNLQADHIIPVVQLIADYGLKTIEEAINCEALWDINNGRTLCIPCHKKTSTYGNRKK